MISAVPLEGAHFGKVILVNLQVLLGVWLASHRFGLAPCVQRKIRCLPGSTLGFIACACPVPQARVAL